MMNSRTALSKKFDTGSFIIGASKFKQICWYLTDIFFFRSKIVTSSTILVWLLRSFGARIGKDVRIKPGIYVKYPWKLIVGDNSWLADCYIDNLDTVQIGTHCCISQQAKLITGNHNYKKKSFDLITQPIILDDGVWFGAATTIGPGVVAGSHAVLTMGSTAVKNLEAYTIYQGNPAIPVKKRTIN